MHCLHRISHEHARASNHVNTFVKGFDRPVKLKTDTNTSYAVTRHSRAIDARLTFWSTNYIIIGLSDKLLYTYVFGLSVFLFLSSNVRIAAVSFSVSFFIARDTRDKYELEFSRKCTAANVLFLVNVVGFYSKWYIAYKEKKNYIYFRFYAID